MNKYRVVENRRIYQGRLFEVRSARLTNSGGESFRRETVVHPGAAAIIPVLPGKRIILVRQYRYATGRELWEIPAGTLEKGERPLACARRELVEETGFRARTFKKLAEFYPCPGYSTERLHLYQATKLTRTPTDSVGEPDEILKVRIFNHYEVRQLLRLGRVQDGKTLIGLMLWLKK
jgi:ADP-ribose pyrophosphatase